MSRRYRRWALIASLGLLPLAFVFQCSLDGLADGVRVDLDAGSEIGDEDPALPIFISGLQTPEEVAVDPHFVYFTTFTNGGSIERCPIAGCNGPPERMASGQAGPQALVVSHGSIGWVNTIGGEIMAGNVDPNAIDKRIYAVASQQPSPAGIISLGRAGAIWSNLGGKRGSPVIARRTDLDPQIVALSRIATSPGPIITPDSVDAVWVEADGLAETPIDGDGQDGQRSCVFVSTPDRPHAIASHMDDRFVIYWTTSKGHIRKVRRPPAAEAIKNCAGGLLPPVTELARNQGNAWAIAVDATHVYFTVNYSENRGSLRRVPTGGGDVEVLLSGLTFPRGVALDDTYAYVAMRNEGAIYRVPKRK